MSPDNPHATAAAARLRNGTINEVARAQVEATLAVAHETARLAAAQETANLIAYQANVEANYRHVPLARRSANAMGLNGQIIAALGFPPEADPAYTPPQSRAEHAAAYIPGDTK